MANPQNLKPWKPGQSGNPAGGARSRRVTTAIAKLLDEKGLDPDFALVAIAMATGRKFLLKDPKEEGGYRKPELGWYALLMDRLEGKVSDKPPEDDGASDQSGPHTLSEDDPRYAPEDQQPPVEGAEPGDVTP